MTNFLIKLAEKNINNDKERRFQIGYMASIVGIIINIVLSIVKLTIGFIISSIGVIADGFNNLTDTLSSIITLIGFKFAHLPPDEEHPYGHGRAEYISGVIVSFIIILVGFQFITSSIKEILNPTIVTFKLIPFLILIISIIFKIWLVFFNKSLSEKINSKTLKAASIDSLGDVFITAVVAISLIIGKFSSFPVDGYVGIIVALIIMYNGYNMIKVTMSPLLGEGPSKELKDKIKGDVLSYKYITGVHDLIIHSYGENKTMAVIDAEFPAELDVVDVYEEIRKAERELSDKYHFTLVIHMDPLDQESDKGYKMRKEIKSILSVFPLYKSMHDFHVLDIEGKDLIEFDMVIYGKKLSENIDLDKIKLDTENILRGRYPKKDFDITLDIDYY